MSSEDNVNENIKVIMGPRGPRGITGKEGPPGPAGPRGETGPCGTQGIAGVLSTEYLSLEIGDDPKIVEVDDYITWDSKYIEQSKVLSSSKDFKKIEIANAGIYYVSYSLEVKSNADEIIVEFCQNERTKAYKIADVGPDKSVVISDSILIKTNGIATEQLSIRNGKDSKLTVLNFSFTIFKIADIS